METLGIKWPELIAQLISFSIVLFVLWKAAYKPVFTMLEARRAKIAESVANSERIKTQLAQTEADRHKILAEAGVQANKLIEDARTAVARVTEVETQKAIAAAEQIVAKARDLMAPVLGTSQCANLIERVLNLEQVKDMRELRPLLQRI